MRHVVVHPAALVCAVAVFVSGCGSSGNDATDSSPTATVAIVGPTVAPTTAAPEPQPTRSTATSNPPSVSVVEANGEIVDIVALDNTFRPERVEVVAGTAIRWENRGRNDHDVVPADEALTWGIDASGFSPGDEYTLVFDTPGHYPYFCSIHGTKDVGMIGAVVVVAVDRGTS